MLSRLEEKPQWIFKILIMTTWRLLLKYFWKKWSKLFNTLLTASPCQILQNEQNWDELVKELVQMRYGLNAE